MQWVWTNKKKNAVAKSKNPALVFFLPEKSTVYGNLEASGPCYIEGIVEGNIVTRDAVTISRNATVIGSITCADAFIYGRVCRNIQCDHKAIIFEGAYVEGQIAAPVTDIQENAIVKNTISEDVNHRNTNSSFTDTSINAVVSLPKVMINESTWF